MATVEVTFTPLPAHVRTARLVATAVARRSGVDEALLDEVRLAVGEACSRAVEAHRRHCPAEPVKIEMTDQGERFVVVFRRERPDELAVGRSHGLKPKNQVRPASRGAGRIAPAVSVSNYRLSPTSSTITLAYHDDNKRVTELLGMARCSWFRPRVRRLPATRLVPIGNVFRSEFQEVECSGMSLRWRQTPSA